MPSGKGVNSTENINNETWPSVIFENCAGQDKYKHGQIHELAILKISYTQASDRNDTKIKSWLCHVAKFHIHVCCGKH